MKNKRTHCSDSHEKIILKEMKHLFEDNNYYYSKPPGFWYQIDDDWERWCKDEDFHCGKFKHEIIINDCNILIIDTLEKFEKFVDEYSTTDLKCWKFNKLKVEKLINNYDGLEISHYFYEYRLNVHWYYSWDCASGVIWTPRNATVNYLCERL